MNPIISICIPTYNCENTIDSVLNSVLSQNCCKCEIIMVDDCSKDATVLIASKYIPKGLKLEVNSNNLGIMGNWNKCYQAAKGDWVYLLGHDDMLVDGAVGQLINLVNSIKTNVKIIAFNGYFPSIDYINKRKYIGFQSSSFMIKNYLPVLHVVPPSEFLVNRSMGEQVGWLSGGYTYSPEIELQFLVYKYGGDYFGLDDVYVIRGKEQNSVTTTASFMRVASDRLRFLSRVYANYSLLVLINYTARIFYDLVIVYLRGRFK